MEDFEFQNKGRILFGEGKRDEESVTSFCRG